MILPFASQHSGSPLEHEVPHRHQPVTFIRTEVFHINIDCESQRLKKNMYSAPNIVTWKSPGVNFKQRLKYAADEVSDPEWRKRCLERSA
jgi:hypothetical protein